VRKIVFGFAVTVLVCGMGFGQVTAPAAAPLPSTVSAVSQGGAGKTMLLWPEGAPGALGDEDVDKPTLTVFLPVAPNPTKTGVVVAPGGSYTHLAMEKEGFAFARWLNERGVAAFVLQYRLGPRYHNPVELGDAQRAVRLVRARAAEFGVNPAKIGALGFSAGGHLVSTLETHFDAGDAHATDPIDRVSCRPDFAVLAYPVISMTADYSHGGSRDNLLGENASMDEWKAMSSEFNVRADTPPTFIFSSSTDDTVPPQNSVAFYSALLAAKVPAELHIFEKAPHGVGMDLADPSVGEWTALMLHWMRGNGFLPAGAE